LPKLEKSIQKKGAGLPALLTQIEASFK